MSADATPHQASVNDRKEESPVTTPSPERLMTIREVIVRTSLSRAHIYALIKKGEFPSQRRLGNKCARWVESEIDAWTKGIIA